MSSGDMIVYMLGIFVIIVVLGLSRYIVVPPNKALVVWGGPKTKQGGLTILTAGGKFVIPGLEKFAFLDIESSTLHMYVSKVLTVKGHQVHLDCDVQYQIDPSEDGLRTAATMLLNKTKEERDLIALGIMEGGIRGSCASLTVAQIHADSLMVSEQFMFVAIHDLQNLGMTVISCTIKDMRVTETDGEPFSNGIVETVLMERIQDLEQKVADLVTIEKRNEELHMELEFLKEEKDDITEKMEE